MSKFLDKDGLSHLWSGLKTKLANKQDKITGTNKLPYSYISDTPTIPTKTSQLTNDSGYTTNTGTITGIKMNGASKGTSGVVDLGTVITSHQDISGKAPTSHASSATTYGVGTSSSYGHCKTINNLTSSSYGNGYALSAYQGYVLNQNKLNKTSVKTAYTSSNADTYSCNYINNCSIKRITANFNLWDLEPGFYIIDEGLTITIGHYGVTSVTTTGKGTMVVSREEGEEIYVVGNYHGSLNNVTVSAVLATYIVEEEKYGIRTNMLSDAALASTFTQSNFSIYNCNYINDNIDPNNRNMTVGTLTSKNLFNIHDVTYASTAYQYIDEDTISINYVDGATGYCIFNKIDNYGGPYNISDNGSSGVRILIKAYDSSNNIITDLSISGFTYNAYYKGYYKDDYGGIDTTFTLPSRVAYFNIGLISTSTSGTNYYKKILLEKGSTATEYSKYQSFNYINNNYSTSENITGKTWIDGKPIYRKVVHYTGALSTTTTIWASTPNLKAVISYGGYVPFGSTFYTIPCSETANAFISLSAIRSDRITINVGSSWGSSFTEGCYIVMEYTKTTD